ncbi:hypothetical protein [Streptomyces sp. NPDC015130]|uniref:hypothetical protein n=1 Tax=Streptomyces sp. NPDC015130 TaxID=3364940 RepID=UPI0036F7A429
MRISPMNLKSGDHVILAGRPETVTAVQDAGDWMHVSVTGWDDDPYLVRPHDTVEVLHRPTGISPRLDEYENNVQHFWRRTINGVSYHFVHVKVSRHGHPYIAVTRSDGVPVRCTCRQSDCPSV